MSHHFAIDYMHTICIGIVAKMLDLWFSPTYKRRPFSISSFVAEVDNEIRKNEISRISLQKTKGNLPCKAMERFENLLF